MQASPLITALERLAPLRLAGDWDNVGLLVEAPSVADPAPTVLLTIDLTEAVLAEAKQLGATFVVAYHPVVFQGIKRVTRATVTGRILLDAIGSGISIYCPHTALDAVGGGVNDWLADALGAGNRVPIEPARNAEDAALGWGMGRLVTLREPASLPVLLAKIKAHLGLAQVRMAAAPAHQGGAVVTTVAVCAGAGGALFEKLRGVDLFWTGEMRHHDVLGRTSTGSSVILCEHTNTERGFLRTLAAQISGELPDATIHVAETDRDPLVHA